MRRLVCLGCGRSDAGQLVQLVCDACEKIMESPDDVYEMAHRSHWMDLCAECVVDGPALLKKKEGDA